MPNLGKVFPRLNYLKQTKKETGIKKTYFGNKVNSYTQKPNFQCETVYTPKNDFVEDKFYLKEE